MFRYVFTVSTPHGERQCDIIAESFDSAVDMINRYAYVIITYSGEYPVKFPYMDLYIRKT